MFFLEPVLHELQHRLQNNIVCQSYGVKMIYGNVPDDVVEKPLVIVRYGDVPGHSMKLGGDFESVIALVLQVVTMHNHYHELFEIVGQLKCILSVDWNVKDLGLIRFSAEQDVNIKVLKQGDVAVCKVRGVIRGNSSLLRREAKGGRHRVMDDKKGAEL